MREEGREVGFWVRGQMSPQQKNMGGEESNSRQPSDALDLSEHTRGGDAVVSR